MVGQGNFYPGMEEARREFCSLPLKSYLVSLGFDTVSISFLPSIALISSKKLVFVLPPEELRTSPLFGS